MTCDQISKVMSSDLRSVPFQCLKLANFGIYAGDIDMDRCWEVTSMVYSDIVDCDLSEVHRGHQRSMTFDDVICHFRVLCPHG